MKQRPIAIDDELYNELKEWAKRNKVYSIAQAVRIAIRKLLGYKM